jgi:hypothetical protein
MWFGSVCDIICSTLPDEKDIKLQLFVAGVECFFVKIVG